ncbi:MAG: hypothetical protein AB7F64_09085, partial [Gammaproteobacteria bacterium]
VTGLFSILVDNVVSISILLNLRKQHYRKIKNLLIDVVDRSLTNEDGEDELLEDLLESSHSSSSNTSLTSGTSSTSPRKPGKS